MKGVKRLKFPNIKQISHVDIIYSIGNIINNIVIVYGIMYYGYWTYHFFRYVNVKRQCHTPKTSTILYVGYILIKIFKRKKKEEDTRDMYSQRKSLVRT